MIYHKKESKQLTIEEFSNPPAKFRGAPFWACFTCGNLGKA